MSDKVWARHSNPWSGWTRVLSIPVLAIGLFLHSWWIMGAIAVWIIVNPMLFSPPKSINNWMSKGVLGEKLYTQGGKFLKKDLPTLLNLLNGAAFFFFLWYGWSQDLYLMIATGLLHMTFKFWYLDRMVVLYERHLEKRP